MSAHPPAPACYALTSVNTTTGASTSPIDKRSLFVVVFEVQPDPAHESDYLRIASELRPELAKIEGFLLNERFQSQAQSGVLLSLSLWDDEKALIRWRTTEMHAKRQEKGRSGVLANYHLRVGEVTLVTGPFANRRVGWIRYDETDVGVSKGLVILDAIDIENDVLSKLIHDASSGNAGIVGCESFSHITFYRRMAVLIEWRTTADAQAFAERVSRVALTGLQVYAVRILRNYGMHDRREAPQFRP